MLDSKRGDCRKQDQPFGWPHGAASDNAIAETPRKSEPGGSREFLPTASLDEENQIQLKPDRQHLSPTVVAALASGCGAPKRVLKSLLKHSDPTVVNAAKRGLEN